MSDIDAVVADAEADFWREKWQALAEELNELHIKRDNDVIRASERDEMLRTIYRRYILNGQTYDEWYDNVRKLAGEWVEP